jgi:hypothetical protein
MGIEIEEPLRRQRKKKAPVSKGAKRSARWRDNNREEYLRRHREEEAARRAKQRAEKAAAAQVARAVAASVIDLGAIRAQRAAEVAQVVVEPVDREEIAG